MIPTEYATVTGNIFQHLETATVEILRHAFKLAEYKEQHSKAEYYQFLREYGWKKNGSEQKQALKVATAFADFIQCPETLAHIEPKTLYLLAQPEYKPAIAQLQDLGEITQAVVVELMKECRIARKRKPIEPPSIWKRTPNGGRYCQLPPIHEEDEATGMTIQNWMDKLGHTAQHIIREAIAALSRLPEWQIDETTNSNTASVDGRQQQQQLEEIYQLGVPVAPSGNEKRESEATQPELLQDINDLIETELTNNPEPLLDEADDWAVVRIPSARPMSPEEKSLDEIDMLGECEFGGGATEPEVALSISQDELNKIQSHIEFLRDKLEKCSDFQEQKSLKAQIKEYSQCAATEQWMANRFASQYGIDLTIYYSPSLKRYNYRLSKS